MNLTYEQVDNAETMSSTYEEAYDSLKTAIETLRNSGDKTAKGIAEGLDDFLIEIESDKEQYDRICEIAYQQDIDELTRDYWRSVL